jgi:D-alanyl-lipoteichoic acid acyltransferase DltB (MBOAT superfamily)
MAALRRMVPGRDQHGYNGAIFGVIFLLVLHRADAFFLLFLLGFNYGLVTVPVLNVKLTRAVLWTTNLWVLYKVKTDRNFIHPSPLDVFEGTELCYTRSMFPWWLSFNLLFLRLISFVEDALVQREAKPSFVCFLLYATYPPLYIAGPIIRFEEFRVQLASREPVKTAELLRYLVRFGVLLLSFEVFSQYVYATAMARNLKGLNLQILTFEDIKTTFQWSFASLFGA